MKKIEKVADLLSMEIDIDVVDDYDERLWIAFCGAVNLTEIGKDVFANALELPIKITAIGTPCENAVVHCENSKQAREAAYLFESLAGYCTEDEWELWFEEV